MIQNEAQATNDFNLDDILNPNIRLITDRSQDVRVCRKWNENTIFLDNNENPYNIAYNRMSFSCLAQLSRRIGELKHLKEENVCVGTSIEEFIDILYRCVCQANVDNVIAVEPTENPYRRYAEINAVEYRRVLPGEDFNVTATQILGECDNHTKIIWLSSPNNPTGNVLDADEIMLVLDLFRGIVVIDETYVAFSSNRGFVNSLSTCRNLLILSNVCNEWGMSGLGISAAYGANDMIRNIRKIQTLPNISTNSLQYAIKQLENPYDIGKWQKTVMLERQQVMNAFSLLPFCMKVYPTEANFFLVKMRNAHKVYQYLLQHNILVHDCSDLPMCEDCLRITIGTKSQNNALLSVLRQYEESRTQD